ncbi:urease accessory protein UreF [Tolumonas lignilytica]|uniref:urease accessory protein UreF n=1 Tax=Tolumonas lignilytica TaxID=1283284 RepID=UPI000464EAC7|nr:urease accessory UreF family protein [Tolumonas lignilytica]
MVEATLNQHSAQSWLQLFQLMSPNLPVGGFTYSQGLEWAVEAGWVKNAAEFEQWLSDQMEEGLVYLDWPLLNRLHLAALEDDIATFEECIDLLVASRESEEFRLEENQRGEAFYRVIKDWNIQGSADMAVHLKRSQLAGMAWFGAKNGISVEQLALGWGFAILEGAVMAAIKLVPIGQQAGQTLLRQLSVVLPEAYRRACAVEDEEIGGSLTRLAIASACHEIQYTRLFRS